LPEWAWAISAAVAPPPDRHAGKPDARAPVVVLRSWRPSSASQLGERRPRGRGASGRCAISFRVIFITIDSILQGTFSVKPPSPTRTSAFPPQAKRKRSVGDDGKRFRIAGVFQEFTLAVNAAVGNVSAGDIARVDGGYCKL
jgi:hypothetical protein